jgi:hypothetical protein
VEVDMLSPGTRVRRITKKVGQAAPEGKIVGTSGHAYEVEWDDGHTTITDPVGVVKVKKPQKK